MFRCLPILLGLICLDCFSQCSFPNDHYCVGGADPVPNTIKVKGNRKLTIYSDCQNISIKIMNDRQYRKWRQSNYADTMQIQLAAHVQEAIATKVGLFEMNLTYLFEYWVWIQRGNEVVSKYQKVIMNDNLSICLCCVLKDES